MSTGASREAPVDNLGTWAKAEKHALSTGASREAPVDTCGRRQGAECLSLIFHVFAIQINVLKK